MSWLLFGDKIKGLKRATKLAGYDEWLYEINQRLVTLEEENKKLKLLELSLTALFILTLSHGTEWL